MGFQGALFSSEESCWQTPDWLFQQLDDEFHFVLDAAAVAQDAKCAVYVGPDNPVHDQRDARFHEWPGHGPAFQNPPYGRGVGEFVRACCREGVRRVVVALILARTDTAWWHNYVMDIAAEARLIRGRVRFIDPETGEERDACPAPSVVVVWRPEHSGPTVVSSMEQRR